MRRSTENSSCNVLSKEDIDQYWEQGYLSPFTLFDNQQIVETRGYVNQLLDQVGDDNRYAIDCFQARLAGLWDLCANEKLLDYVEDLIGPDIICWASHLFCKNPHDPKKVPWHQDALFWHLPPNRTVTVWLAIDDADRANSAMAFLPGTHTMGSLPAATADDESVLKLATQDAETLGQPFFNELSAGEFSLHTDMLVHGSEPNASSRRRCGLTIRYCSASVRMSDERWAAGVEPIVCRGNDDNYWQHSPRPENDVVQLHRPPLNIGGN